MRVREGERELGAWNAMVLEGVDSLAYKARVVVPGAADVPLVDSM